MAALRMPLMLEGTTPAPEGMMPVLQVMMVELAMNLVQTSVPSPTTIPPKAFW